MDIRFHGSHPATLKFYIGSTLMRNVFVPRLYNGVNIGSINRLLHGANRFFTKPLYQSDFQLRFSVKYYDSFSLSFFNLADSKLPEFKARRHQQVINLRG